MSSNYQYPRTEFDPKPRRRFRLGARGWLLAITAFVILLDRLTKFWVDRHLALGATITVIPRVFRISHVLNTGAAFSVFSESASPEKVRTALVLFSVFAALMVFVMLWRVGRTFTVTSVALALILGGALGNLYDRIHYHFVIDFLEVHIVHYHWPDFNIADSCIVIGACLLITRNLPPPARVLNQSLPPNARLPRTASDDSRVTPIQLPLPPQSQLPHPPPRPHLCRPESH